MSTKLPIERLDALEKKHGVELNVNAFLEYNEYSEAYSASIIGEVFGDLNYDIRILMSIYNSAGEIIGADSTYIDSDNYEGIEPFKEDITAPKGEQIAKVRIYPQKR
jgi:hypothetical protein